MSAQTLDDSWMHEQISAEQYDAMPEDQCRDIEIVDGMVHMGPKPTAYHNDVGRWIANGIEAAGRPVWRTTTDVDLRLRTSRFSTVSPMSWSTKLTRRAIGAFRWRPYSP